MPSLTLLVLLLPLHLLADLHDSDTPAGVMGQFPQDVTKRDTGCASSQQSSLQSGGEDTKRTELTLSLVSTSLSDDTPDSLGRS